MNKRLAKKLAYYSASMKATEETGPIGELFRRDGIELTPDEMEMIANMELEIFRQLSRKSDGWEKLIKRENA